MNQMDVAGRLMPLKYFPKKGLSINVGCKTTYFADINMDIKRGFAVNIIASALNIPFKNSSFATIYLMEVLEHLPKNTEEKAIKELRRILKTNGILIMSVPNKGVWEKIDPAYYLINHRHYDMAKVCGWLENNAFNIKLSCTMGSLWELFGNYVYCFLLFPLNKITKSFLTILPYIEKKTSKEFQIAKESGSSNIFILAKKD